MVMIIETSHENAIFQTVFFLLPVHNFFRICLQEIEENHGLALSWMVLSSVILMQKLAPFLQWL